MLMTVKKMIKEGLDESPLIHEINQHPLAANDYFTCIQCGRCVGSCPATMVSEKFNMRVINRRILDGDLSLLEDDVIWDCFYCEACVNLCPRKNLDSYKTILILRDLALAKGYGIQHMTNILPLMKWYMEKGVLTQGKSWMDADAIDEVRKINEITGLNRRVLELESKLEEARVKKK